MLQAVRICLLKSGEFFFLFLTFFFLSSNLDISAKANNGQGSEYFLPSGNDSQLRSSEFLSGDLFGIADLSYSRKTIKHKRFENSGEGRS